MTCDQFFESNVLIFTLFFACVLWCIISVFFYIYFRFLVSFGGNGGFTIEEIHEDKEAGMNYLLALIAPLLIGDLNEWQNTVAFVIIFLIIFILLMKTELLYANPGLTLLGYHVYKLTFSDNHDIAQQCIAISTVEITCENTIEYKKITNSVVFTKVIKTGGTGNAGK